MSTAGRNSGYNKTYYNTPQKYVDAVLSVFDEINLDPCSNLNSIVPAKVKYILPTDGLKESWSYERIYVNPPFGRGLNKTSIYDWLEKCYLANKTGSDVIALIPVATNTKHWKNFVFNSDVICFLNDTRLKFRIGESENNKGISISCAMIYWGSESEKFYDVFKNFGNCVKKYE